MKYVKGLDTLRAFAAIAVILGHWIFSAGWGDIPFVEQGLLLLLFAGSFVGGIYGQL